MGGADDGQCQGEVRCRLGEGGLCVSGCGYRGHIDAAGSQRGDPAVVEAQPQRLGTGVGEGDVEWAGEGEQQLSE